MHSVYVLKSLKNGKCYVGYTGKKVAVRLKEHNTGSNSFTRLNRPFVLLRSEQYGDKKMALKREHFLKSGQGRKFLNELLGR